MKLGTMLIIFLGIFYVIYVKIAPTDTIPLNRAEMKMFDTSKIFEGQVLVPRVSIIHTAINAGISVFVVAVTGVGRIYFALIVAFVGSLFFCE